mmetsp:Transcript_8517/g.12444  ORF Transcript_8517/g.12444 Transcript_8517/m.12444 type:complete len:199 (-) Transcript_8517:160-756(-)|eukprot:CAMPEP_0194047928 /NCGR_PEP_ID=MMETSP0009_2-20130614/26234_1 /TAXON_ID=210454 /ORGANISM="Grammatophora oceanica, Strain CCMP 410" /LENGTH=198 /DNA_ID=CAMNT_0038693685 /DNA_START=73 /DNA_END=669 /DNA_ORIENTATION=+
MPPYGEPDWANPDNAGASSAPTQNAGLPAAAAAPSAGGGGGGSSGGGRNSWVLAGLSVADMGIAGMMAALGVLVLLDFRGQSTDDYSEAFLAAYMICFATLLFLYELMWWTAIPKINKALRRNFGFLYGLIGKGLYLVFVAFLCLGLGDDNNVKELTWATGIAFLAFGVLHIFVSFGMPLVAEKYKAPSAGLVDDSVV